MANIAAGIIFSSLNDNTLSRLTSDRTVSAIPFACRYRLIDFALSSLVNANISNINIVSNYNYRSLLEHIGSGKDWDLARHSGGINIISPFQTRGSEKSRMFKTHMEALINMKEYIDEFKEEYVILIDSDSVLNIDITELINHHIETRARITLVTTKTDAAYTSKHNRMMISSKDGKIVDIKMSDRHLDSNPELSLNIYVMSTVYLGHLISLSIAHKENSLTRLILEGYKNERYLTYCYSGYAFTVSSFLDYYRYSLELVKNEDARNSLLNRRERPIFTKVHNSAPVIYKDGATVESSMIADDCVIEGTVINSLLFRNVHIGRGAVVKDCVLFSGTYVSDNASLNSIVTDKDVFVSDGVTLSGNGNMPFYIPKGRKI